MRIVATFSKPEEAYLLRSHLEGNGVAAFVRDDQTVTADWALSNAIGGVKVEVADDDYDAVRAIIAEFAPPQAPQPEVRPKHEFGRYVKIFATVFVALYGFLVWRAAPAPVSIYGILLLPSVFLAACVAGIGAVFDL